MFVQRIDILNRNHTLRWWKVGCATLYSQRLCFYRLPALFCLPCVSQLIHLLDPSTPRRFKCTRRQSHSDCIQLLLRVTTVAYPLHYERPPQHTYKRMYKLSSCSKPLLPVTSNRSCTKRLQFVLRYNVLQTTKRSNTFSLSWKFRISTAHSRISQEIGLNLPLFDWRAARIRTPLSTDTK